MRLITATDIIEALPLTTVLSEHRTAQRTMADGSGDDCSRWCIEACAATAVGTTEAQRLLNELTADNNDNQKA